MVTHFLEVPMKRILACLACVAVVLGSGGALAADLPAYDTDAYCKQIGEAAGGSYAIEESCQKREKRAQDELAKMDIEPRIFKHCEKIGSTAGGTYAIFQSCVKREMGAKQRLGK